MDAMISRDDREHGLLDETTPAIAAPTARRLSTRDTLDQFAGDTIDNETGEIVDEQQTNQDVKGDQTKDVKQGAGEATAEQESSIVADPAITGTASQEMTMDEGVAGAESTVTTEADSLPTNRDQFKTYFAAEIAKIEDPRKVVEWFNSTEQKKLRDACDTAPIFQDLLRDAGDRRNYLTQSAAGTTAQTWPEWLAARRK
jgi:hypothetical protein